MKKLLPMVLILSLMLALMAPAALASGTTEDAPGTVLGDWRLQILFTNDTHGQMVADQGDFFAKMSGYAYAYRAAYTGMNRHLLLLDAGDTIYGTPGANGYNGASVISAMNSAKYDAMTIGVREFSYGFEHLRVLQGNARFPMLSANISYAEGGDPPFDGYIIKECGDRKVAIIGVTQPETIGIVSPGHTQAYIFNDPVLTLRGRIEEAKKEGADFVIVLGHLGLDENNRYSADKVIGQIDDVDLFIDGLSHVLTETPMTFEDAGGKKVVYVSAGKDMERVGVIDIDEDYDISVTMVDNFDDASSNRETQRLVDTYKKYPNEQASAVGQTTFAMRHEVRLGTLTGQGNLGDLVSDAAKAAVNADAAIVDTLKFGGAIPAGEITQGKISSLFPQGEDVLAVQVTGKEILAVAQDSLQRTALDYGAFALLGGDMEIAVEEADKGEYTLLDVNIGGKPLDPDKEYKIAVTSTMIEGADRFLALTEGMVVSNAGPVSACVASFIQSMPNQTVDGKYALPQGRVKIYDVVGDPATYTITYNANGGTGTKANDTATPTSPLPCPTACLPRLRARNSRDGLST